MLGQSKLSIVIPTYNSYNSLSINIDYLINSLTSKDIVYDIIVVDDGSHESQRTENLCLQKNIQYIHLPENRGKGYALKTGFEKASGEFILFTDADIPYDSQSILDIINKLENGYDFVTGDRTLPGSRYFDSVPMKRVFFGKAFTFLTKLLLGDNVDSQCGLKGFKNSVGKKIFSLTTIERFAIDFEVFYLARRLNYKFSKVPVSLRSTDGKSVRVFYDGMVMLKDVSKLLIKSIFD